MDNYQAMNYYYGLLNLHAGFFNPHLCTTLMLVAQSVEQVDEQTATAYHTVNEKEEQPQAASEPVEFGSFYEDGHILHNVKITTQSDFFLDPTRGDTVKWQVKFTVAKDVRPADQFIVQLSNNLIIAPNGHPHKPIVDFADQDGVVIAMGEYNPTKHQLVYTFTNYVTEHRRITGEIAGELAIDPQTIPENEFGLACFISVDDYQKDFTIDVDYPDLGNDMFLGISSRMMAFDQDKHLFTDLIYVNPGQKELSHAYIVFNTSEMVEELSNAIVKPSTMRIEIYQNSHGLKLPQSYGVNLHRLRDVTNRFPVVEGDHLVDTPLTMSFADNKMRLNFTAKKTNDSYVIKVIGQYDDELQGDVRLRARLFGMDQQNVYMSNSTAASATGITMTASGHAVPKEEHESVSKVSEKPAPEKAQEPVAPPVEEPVTEPQSLAPIESDEPAIAADNDFVPASSTSEVGLSTVSEEESPIEEPVVEQAPVATEKTPVEEEQTAEESAYIISFDQSASAANEPEQSDDSKGEDSPVASPAVEPRGTDELSISFDVPVSESPTETKEESAEIEEVDSEVTEQEEEQPLATSSTTDEEEQPASTAEIVEEVTVEEEPTVEPTPTSTTAPLPKLSRRPPRRSNRFQRNGRTGHTMRHLRRF
ncbi:fibrinogen-binding adhesin SdrG C-terminal domain-containing protein [Limosilactobacillus sp. STM2_1]|uniref:Fibrinogen-binding adhesin SdrG C-terminal domain-containing protein n=1 Tax=Limosilactobacillus rudii TaxID=2759755 RepID=A0A7W3UKB0_9LACO|nr:fibrinogen-binding adhesin SdrG C-terminal domain-containing protein [Limosilactobacillus rudii]MBB1078370.1 fibrinogen-binding adhesin SdrG C-terminal domain-containing protein [Limosilactobacillus rudii]MBB1096500.1 fibrinogen-binding adhesin SdrG C-terminal domain-containing protein [Limosilactobacillus rudii]MCD7134303.1 fibrinogen-binding adhesin SdrG C-terminal domain-containing protein [Limosilactobacillus rudii]